MSSTASYLAIIDRFLDPRNPHSLQRAGGELNFWLLVVFIFYIGGIVSIHLIDENFGKHREVKNVLVIQLVAPDLPELVKPIPPVEKIVNAVIASPGSDKSLTSAPLKQLVVKNKSVMKAGQPVVGPTMKIATSVPPQIIHELPMKKIDTANVAAPQRMTSTTNNPISPSTINNTSNEINNEGPKQGGIGGQDSGLGVGNQTNYGNGGGGNDADGKGGQKIAMLGPGAASAMGNIAPYRKDMLARIAQSWKPSKHLANIQNAKNLVAIISIGADGRLLNCELITSSGDENLDQYASSIIERTKFAELPSWFKGDHLRFKVELSKVEAIKSEI